MKKSSYSQGIYILVDRSVEAETDNKLNNKISNKNNCQWVKDDILVNSHFDSSE